MQMFKWILEINQVHVSDQRVISKLLSVGESEHTVDQSFPPVTKGLPLHNDKRIPSPHNHVRMYLNDLFHKSVLDCGNLIGRMRVLLALGDLNLDAEVVIRPALRSRGVGKQQC